MLTIFVPRSLIWLGWLQGLLWVILAAACLCSMGVYYPSSTASLTRLRQLSFVGVVVTTAEVFGVAVTKLAPLAILILPAPVCFAVLIFQPVLARKSRTLRIYLTVCVALEVVALCLAIIL